MSDQKLLGSAVEHATLRVPTAGPGETAGGIRDRLPGGAFEFAGDVLAGARGQQGFHRHQPGLPWLFQRLGADPAFGAGPLSTVIQDLLSIAVYLAIAIPLAA